MDSRFDPRDGQFRLLDFNPRVGANPVLLDTDVGVNAVRAIYLSMTGRGIPRGVVRDRTTLVVEHLDRASRIASNRAGIRGVPAPLPARIRHAGLADDDPAPVTVAVALASRMTVAVAPEWPACGGGRIETERAPDQLQPHQPAPAAVPDDRFTRLVTARRRSVARVRVAVNPAP